MYCILQTFIILPGLCLLHIYMQLSWVRCASIIVDAVLTDFIFNFTELHKIPISRLSGFQSFPQILKALSQALRPFTEWHCLEQPGIILGMGSANERWCYIVTSSLIGWTHTQYDPWATISGVNFNNGVWAPQSNLIQIHIAIIGTIMIKSYHKFA